MGKEVTSETPSKSSDSECNLTRGLASNLLPEDIAAYVCIAEIIADTSSG